MAGFRKAEPMQKAIKASMYGPPGSGKSFTSLLLAEGIAKREGKRVAYVDTEHGTDFYAMDVPSRKAHPAAFDFDAMYTKSLSEIDRELRALKTDDYSVVVIDSITHLWVAAREAYTGGKNGKIPFHAWATIKKPYLAIIAMLMNSPYHVFLVGRQGTEYGYDDDGELVALGPKMKAEGETPYEPNLTIRMDPTRDQKGGHIIRAYIEKDRSGVLAGKLIPWPTFDNLAKPLLEVMTSPAQARIQTSDEAAIQDAEQKAVDDEQKARISATMLRQFSAQLDLCSAPSEVAEVNKAITVQVKQAMTRQDLTVLKQRWMAAKNRVEGMAEVEVPVTDGIDEDPSTLFPG